MKKYRVSFCKRFTAKNQKNYVSIELTAVDPAKDKKDGTYFGHRTYSVIASAEKFPANVLPDDLIECSVSFDEKTGEPFAYGFKACQSDEPVEFEGTEAE